MRACLDGRCDFPAPIGATILENHKEYSNFGTVSGSQLHKDCDYATLLDQLPYTKEISDMFWATYRGSNVHAMIEKCKVKPEFKDWIFEKRFFAVLNPDDSIDKLDVPLKKSGEEDWLAFRKICDDLITKGCIILSGQVDTFDKPKSTLEDWKGQPLTSKILTPKGWALMGDLKVGDSVIGSRGQATKIKGVYPLGVRDIYEVKFSDGSVVECTGDHLWTVQKSGGSRPFKTITTLELQQETTDDHLVATPRIGKNGPRVVRGQRRQSFRLVHPHSSPICFNRWESLPVNPYVVGVMLGDGCDSRLTSCDPEIANSISRLQPTWTRTDETDIPGRVPGYYFGGRARKDLSSIGLTKIYGQDKKVPDRYLFSHPHNRLALLQGLLDTDGWPDRCGVAKFSTTNLHLAEAVKHITWSLGGVVHHSKRYTKRPHFKNELQENILTVRLPAGVPPFRLKRKLKKWISNPFRIRNVRRIVSVTKTRRAKAQCIKVTAKNGLYTTDDFVITHNTAKSVGDWTEVKQSWQQQMNQYSLILFLHGLVVRRIRITVMDATLPVLREVPVPDLESWAGLYLVPRVRYLASLQRFTPEEIQAINDGECEAPAGYPKPKPNYLCNAKNKEGKVYCPHKAICPAWREPDLTAQLEESLRRSKSKKAIQKSNAAIGPEETDGGWL